MEPYYERMSTLSLKTQNQGSSRKVACRVFTAPSYYFSPSSAHQVGDNFELVSHAIFYIVTAQSGDQQCSRVK